MRIPQLCITVLNALKLSGEILIWLWVLLACKFMADVLCAMTIGEDYIVGNTRSHVGPVFFGVIVFAYYLAHLYQARPRRWRRMLCGTSVATVFVVLLSLCVSGDAVRSAVVADVLAQEPAFLRFKALNEERDFLGYATHSSDPIARTKVIYHWYDHSTSNDGTHHAVGLLRTDRASVQLFTWTGDEWLTWPSERHDLVWFTPAETRRLLEDGLPDWIFMPIEEDDRRQRRFELRLNSQ